MGQSGIDPEDGSDSLEEDYKTIAVWFKESVDGSYDAVEFSVSTSNLLYPDVSLQECTKALNGEIQALVDTVREVLVFPDNILDEIKHEVTAYGEKYKDHICLGEKSNHFSVGIEVEMQTVEGEDDNIFVRVDIRTFKDNHDSELSPEEETIDEKTIYFHLVGNS